MSNYVNAPRNPTNPQDPALIANVLQMPTSAAWKNQLRPGPKGGYKGDENNILRAFDAAPRLKDLLRFNEFSQQIEFTRLPPWRNAQPGDPWIEQDDTQATAWLQGQGLSVGSKAAVADCVKVIANKQPFHPVRTYLSDLQWDGVPRLATWLTVYLGAVGPEKYLGAVGKRFLISAVARIFRPGCQADCMLVLEGPQGLQKTTLARTLATKAEWFAGHLPDVHSKDAMLQLQGHWLIEIAELSAIRGANLQATKSFLSQVVDTFRPPYGRRPVKVPRQVLFIGTTNEREYLRDRTGNRRYWPVLVTWIDLARVQRDLDQLWAEAVALFDSGEQWHLTPEEDTLAQIEQGDRVPQSEVERKVADYLATLAQDSVTVRQVLQHALNISPDTIHFADQAKKHGTEVAAAITQCGWIKDSRTRGDGQRNTHYTRPAKVAKVNS